MDKKLDIFIAHKGGFDPKSWPKLSNICINKQCLSSSAELNLGSISCFSWRSRYIHYYLGRIIMSRHFLNHECSKCIFSAVNRWRIPSVFLSFVLSLISLNSFCSRPEDKLPNTGIVTVPFSHLAYVLQNPIFFKPFF